MLRRFSINFAIFSILLDLTLIILAIVIAVLIRPDLNTLPGVVPIRVPLDIQEPLYFFLPLCWMIINLGSGLYDERHNLHFIDEISKLIETALLATGAMAGLLFLSYREISRTLFLSFVIIAFSTMLIWRVFARLLWRLNHRGETRKRQVLIIGAGNVGHQVAAAIQENSNRHIHLVGFLDDDPQKHKKNHEVLGPLAALETLLKSRQVNDIVIALPPNSYTVTAHIVETLQMAPITVWIIPDSYRLALSSASIETFAGIPLLNVRAPVLSEYQRMLKRVFDLVFASLFLIPAAPVMALIALLVKLDNRGPAIFQQKRVGENTRVFDMFKFRTMVMDAETIHPQLLKLDENGNIIHKIPEDPRVTPLGRFLRHYSLDELPQLFNVVKGDMSLVGPRPELPYLVEKYQPWQFVRFSIPQGITGWWQINGRSDKPMHLNTQDDLYYIEHYSFWLDIKIIFRTIFVVIRGKGAY